MQAATGKRSGSMSSVVVHKSVQARGGDAGAWMLRLSCTFRSWIARHQQRKALGDLADGDCHLLKDIGDSRQEAQREAAKWFWQT